MKCRIFLNDKTPEQVVVEDEFESSREDAEICIYDLYEVDDYTVDHIEWMDE